LCCSQFEIDQKNKKTRVKKLPNCCFCSEPNADNIPFPLCEVDDETSMCCDECNVSKVLPLRVQVWNCKSPEEARKKALELSSAPPPETLQVVTVPSLTVTTYPNLQTVITRQMHSYYGYSYFHAPTHDLYGCQLTEGGYNPWSTTRNWEE
jgi:hypothetical protein